MRVNFFRSQHAADSANTTTHLPPPKEHKSVARRLSNFATPRPVLQGRAPSATSDDDHAMVEHGKAKSGGMGSPKLAAKTAPRPATTLEIQMESPPVVLYGSTALSTGALISGQLKVEITKDLLVVESMRLSLQIVVKVKKPFHAHCLDCTNQSTELKSWSFLHGSATWKKGHFDFPFSYLLPGHLPATMHGGLASIDYSFTATLKSPGEEPVTTTRALVVKRSIPPQELPRQSIRIFPPTNLTAHVELPSVIHPIGEFNVKFRLDGIVNPDSASQTQKHWKLRRLTWRLEETQKIIAPACGKHAAKAGAVPGERKGIQHQEVRTLNSEELKSGWKADYASGVSGCVEMEFSASVRPDAKPVCDLTSEDGTEVQHTLVVELIVIEEFAPMRKVTQVTPTGAARVLRMHFNVVLTERGGLGISWDEEQPPLYDDVPASPPGYGKTNVYDGPPIPDYEDLEMMRGGPSAAVG